MYIVYAHFGDYEFGHFGVQKPEHDKTSKIFSSFPILTLKYLEN